MNLRENIKKELSILTEQRREGATSTSGVGVLDMNTMTVVPYTQEIINTLAKHGVDTSGWKGGRNTTQDDNKFQKEKTIDARDVLSEQPTSGAFFVSCLCGIQGIMAGNIVWCPSVVGPWATTSTYFFCYDCTIDGQQPSGGEKWYYDLPYPATEYVVEVIPGSIQPASSTSLPYHDFNSCPCGSTCPSYSTATGCPPHDPSIGYPGNFNVSTWTNQWLNSGPFNNTTTANQPCNHICTQLQTWETNCTSGVGPLHQNQLAAKIEEGDNQYNIHNCSSSTAQAC